MGRITELKLRDVRCFDGEQSARLSRITLLVGENGTGKSTFLGCYQAFARLADMQELDDKNYFNDHPFYMGAFDTIVRAGSSEFAVGGSFEDHCHTGALFSFIRGRQGAPLEKAIELEFTSEHVHSRLDVTRRPTEEIWRFQGPDFRLDINQSEVSFSGISTWLSRSARYGTLPFRGEPADFRKRGKPASEREQAEFAKFASFFRSVLPLPGRNSSFLITSVDHELPCRQRVYESLPSYLDDGGDAKLMVYFVKVGNQLGLWKEVTVAPRPDGQGTEILIDTGNGKHNLMDVGYGIHSLLPLVQALYRHQADTVLLLQQPEVHVHPVAQAQLAQLIAKSDGSVVIETHSDHLVDRFRICVMEGILRPQDLSIVYFEPSGGGSSQIHSITVDPQANLQNVPESYREFFMRGNRAPIGT